MPVRVELIPDADDDLISYAQSGNITQFLQKLIRLETHGRQAGQPLGRGLSGFYKIVVGDRDWRIVYTLDAAETVATVVVIGDRADAACYDQALRRLRDIEHSSTEAASLATAILALPQFQNRKQR